MVKIIFTFLVIIVILLIAFWGYNYFNFQKTAKSPTIDNFEGDQFQQFPQNLATSTSFRGPTTPPSIKGLIGPPPTR